MWRQGASALFRRVTDASPWVLGAFGATALATLAVQESNSLSEPVFTASEVAEHSDLEKVPKVPKKWSADGSYTLTSSRACGSLTTATCSTSRPSCFDIPEAPASS
eukprot:scaffold1883_cov261-Pinguiococcus_pyrenoidosus.AAC.28